MLNRLNAILNSQETILKNSVHTKGFRAGKSFAEIDAIYSASGGLCAICGCKRGNRNHALDHDHKTGELRGVLCYNCNQGLGQFKDDIRLLYKAIRYLKQHKK